MTEAVVLITGAASGIGAATAKKLAGEGARLVLTDLDGAGLGRLAAEIGPERVLTAAFDVGEEAGWQALEDEVRRRFGRLDGLVANAGIAATGLIAEMAFADWRRVMSVNLDGVFLSLRAGMRLIGPGGAMVVVASAAGIKAEAGIAAYGGSKAAALQLTKIAAKEGAAKGVRVNAVAPGGVETPIWRDAAFFEGLVKKAGSEPEALRMMGAATPLGRFARAEEIAELIAFLLSAKAATMTGAALLADGGYTL